VSAPAPSEPLQLHPGNPHYFLFRGKPTVLVTGTEHYGAVLNADFDYVPYLDTLARDGLNLTRTFSGVYMEHPEAFGIAGNTLSPGPGRVVCPWARSDQPGYAGGGERFDLSRWDDAYFSRLRAFVQAASDRGIVVEYVLFCPFYGDEQWLLSPLHEGNNVNGVGAVGSREDVYTARDEGLQRVQEALVRKVVAELAEFDNLYYEVCNEPYFGGVTGEWQDRIAEVITEAEAGLGVKHLIARNIANGTAALPKRPANVSILNFHYATPPDAVRDNYGLGIPVADDETGFRGTEDKTYRSEAWHFLLAGGAAFDHLDYSFSAGHEDGTFEYPASQPGGGSTALRAQLGVLKRFVESLDLPRMSPDGDVIASPLPEGVSSRTLSEAGHCYGIYLEGPGVTELALRLPRGSYEAEWISTLTGEVCGRSSLDSDDEVRLPCPPYDYDTALRIFRR
jgi:hypothetical protein